MPRRQTRRSSGMLDSDRGSNGEIFKKINCREKFYKFGGGKGKCQPLDEERYGALCNEERIKFILLATYCHNEHFHLHEILL